MKEQHEKAMAAAARMHEEAVQVQQQNAKEQLDEQNRAVASAKSALQAASRQASQVCYSSLAAPCTSQSCPSAWHPAFTLPGAVGEAHMAQGPLNPNLFPSTPPPPFF